MAKHLGDFDASAVIYGKFTTFRPSSGATYTLAGTPALSVYKDNSTTQSTSGVTLTADFDSVTGLNHFAIDTSSDGTFYAAGSFFDIVITTGTVDSVSVTGSVVGSFTIRKNSALKPTTAGRALDVSAGGEAGVDWANVGSPTTSLNLSGTTIATTQKVDVDTIKTNPVVNGGTITFPTTATLASTTNITAGTITTATNVTTVNGLASGVITATSIAADAITAAKIADGAIDAATFAAGAINAAAIASDAITDAKVASDVTIASVTGAVGSVTGAVGSVTGNVGGNVTGSVGSVVGAVGSVTGAVGSVTGNVGGNVVGTVASVVGAVGSVTGNVGGNVTGTVASVVGAVGSVTGNVGGNVTGSVGSLATQAKADVNAEVVDALNTDTYAEPGQGTPGATISIAAKVGYLYKAWRNKHTQTSSEYALYADNGSTKDHEATFSDNGTTAERGEITTGA